MPSFNKPKLTASLLLAIVFATLSFPKTFMFTDAYAKRVSLRTTYDNCPGLPTLQGTLIHSALFAVLAYAILAWKDISVAAAALTKDDEPEQQGSGPA